MSEEGEVLSSSELDEHEGASLKKTKLDDAEGDEVASNSGSSSKKDRNIRRKMKRKATKKVAARRKELASNTLEQSQKTFDTLTPKQVLVLRDLVRLSKQEYCEKSSRSLKTEQLRQLVSSIVTRYPGVPNDIDGLDFLREHRIVVVWLSMVSADFFNTSKSHFKKVKSLNPHIQFEIIHPGSARFVKLGLEAFLMTSESQKTLSAQLKKPIIARRDHYLLTQAECQDNDFPVPSKAESLSVHQKDLSAYWNIVEWPSLEAVNRPDTELPMFAVDCEMVDTQEGPTLARISVVNESFECILDTLVKPDQPVLDYKTKYSGIDEECLSDVTTTRADVQNKLSSILPSQCILVGHSLENDLHAIKLIHPYVIDTSLLFTPRATPFSKPSLRHLTKQLLDLEIQCGPNGHNSIEDATACMKLMQLKLEKGTLCTISWNDLNCCSLLTNMVQAGHNTGFIDKQGVVGFYLQDCTHPRKVTTDQECIEVSRTIIPQCQFTFLQLHDMETFMKSPQKGDYDKMLEVAEELDSHVMQIVENCPSKSLVFIVCGSNNISEVKRLQQLDIPDYGRLKTAVTIARTGTVLACLVD